MKYYKQRIFAKVLVSTGAWLCRAVSWLSAGAGRIASYAVFAMTLLVTIDVAMRFLFNSGTQMAVEYAGYLLVVTIFFGLAHTQAEGRHIQVDALVKRFSSKVQDWLNVVSLGLFLIYAIILCHSTWSFFSNSFKYKTTSLTALDVLVWPYQIFMPLGLALLSMLLICVIYNKTKDIIRKKKL